MEKEIYMKLGINNSRTTVFNDVVLQKNFFSWEKFILARKMLGNFHAWNIHENKLLFHKYRKYCNLWCQVEKVRKTFPSGLFSNFYFYGTEFKYNKNSQQKRMKQWIILENFDTKFLQPSFAQENTKLPKK